MDKSKESKESKDHFPESLLVQKHYIDRHNIWKLLADFSFYSARLKQTFTVPAGFTTDFASVPRLPLAYLLTGYTVHESAVIHDWLVRTKPIPRPEADKLFLEAMKVEGISWWRRWSMYTAVRTVTFLKELR